MYVPSVSRSPRYGYKFYGRPIIGRPTDLGTTVVGLFPRTRDDLSLSRYSFGTAVIMTSTFLFTSESVNEGHPGTCLFLDVVVCVWLVGCTGPVAYAGIRGRCVRGSRSTHFFFFFLLGLTCWGMCV
jgi:hypothetical protein